MIAVIGAAASGMQDATIVMAEATSPVLPAPGAATCSSAHSASRADVVAAEVMPNVVDVEVVK